MLWNNRPDLGKSLESIPPQLYYTLLEGLIELVGQLVENRADVNAPGNFGNVWYSALFRGVNVNVYRGGYDSAL
jgi:hypothetical protein